MEFNIQVVLLGAGELWAQNYFSDKANKYPHKFACHIGYDNAIAHKIEAGSDIFLMPSLFEPCGLNQIYSLRYGTIPLVRATGGLEDTIQNYNAEDKSGTGFKFYDATPEALMGTLTWAIDVYYNDKEGFNALIQNAMNKRFEWSDAADEYVALYEKIVQGRSK
jgi:starch synthase